MDLGKACPDIALDQFPGQGHRLLGGALGPYQGPQMVAAQKQIFSFQTDFLSQRLGVGVKIPGRHAGVTAELIDLIAGSLHQYASAPAKGPLHGGLQHKGIGGADRADPNGLSRFLPCHQPVQGMGLIG